MPAAFSKHDTTNNANKTRFLKLMFPERSTDLDKVFDRGGCDWEHGLLIYMTDFHYMPDLRIFSIVICVVASCIDLAQAGYDSQDLLNELD